MARLIDFLIDISIHAARVGCDIRLLISFVCGKIISIHAARVGCDGNAESGIGADDNFNPRSPSGLRPVR